MNRPSKTRGPQTPFAHLVDTGVRAYQRAKRVNGVTRAMEDLAIASGIGFSTLSSWRRDVIPTDYDILKRFMMACVLASAELDESWVSDLLREAGMARYCDEALAEIFSHEYTTTKSAARGPDLEADRRINIAGTLPALPDYYVLRQTKLDALKDLVSAQRDTGGWIAMLGMTGVGKSTLLAALGHDADIRAAFSGNVRWFEVRQTTTTPRLAQRIAQAFGQDLPSENDDVADMLTALHHTLPTGPLLLLLDNVVNPAVVSPLHMLGPQVVVVVTVRAVQDAARLRIPEKTWLTIGELTPEEAWTLAERISPVAEAQIPAAQQVLALLEYHPYITVVAASAALTLRLQWSEILDIVATFARRSQAQRFFASQSINVWATLEMDWEKLDAPQQYALATLGRLPYFLRYDLAVAQAAWGLSANEALVVWKILAAMQLARPAPDVSGEYTVHWLIRDFAADKAKDWSLGQRLRFLGWPWRYRLPFRLRWWWPALRRPQPDPRWPWYALELPGTEGRRGVRSPRSWLITMLWQNNRQNNRRQLNLRVGPVEWATVTRLWVRFLVLAVVVIGLAVAALVVIAQGHKPVGTVLAMLVALWSAVVTHIDLRRASMWWGLQTSLPYTAAYTEQEQEKDPVS